MGSFNRRIIQMNKNSQAFGSIGDSELLVGTEKGLRDRFGSDVLQYHIGAAPELAHRLWYGISISSFLCSCGLGSLFSLPCDHHYFADTLSYFYDPIGGWVNDILEAYPDPERLGDESATQVFSTDKELGEALERSESGFFFGQESLNRNMALAVRLRASELEDALPLIVRFANEAMNSTMENSKQTWMDKIRN